MDHDLYVKLETLRIAPPGACRTFEQRLAIEQRWTEEFTAGAMREYRRFLYLAATCGHRVSPSPAVDAVWHLHLLYTRSYWDDLCGRVLQKPLHHDPATGALEEKARLVDDYRLTLQSYERCFGEPAPTLYWHAPHKAAGDQSAHVPRLRSWLASRTTQVTSVALLLVLVTGVTVSRVLDWVVPLGLFAGTATLALWWKSRSRKTDRDPSSTPPACGGGWGGHSDSRHHGSDDAGGSSGDSSCSGGGDGGGGCGGGGD